MGQLCLLCEGPQASSAPRRPPLGSWHSSYCFVISHLPAFFLAPACRERDRLYERAEGVASALAHLGDRLREAIATVNESTGA